MNSTSFVWTIKSWKVCQRKNLNPWYFENIWMESTYDKDPASSIWLAHHICCTHKRMLQWLYTDNHSLLPYHSHKHRRRNFEKMEPRLLSHGKAWSFHFYSTHCIYDMPMPFDVGSNHMHRQSWEGLHSSHGPTIKGEYWRQLMIWI